MTASYTRYDVQGLRALAVVAVLAFHSGFDVPGGFSGVDIFLVISGYVITGMLLREHIKNGKIKLSNFYIRRIRRLTPALAVVILVVLVASYFLQSPLGPQQNTAVTALGTIFVSANIAISSVSGGYFDLAAESNPLLNMWSLSVEEQFYLMYPIALMLFLFLGVKYKKPSVYLWILILLISSGSFFIALSPMRELAEPFGQGLFGFYGVFSRMWEFSAGAMLALLPKLRPRRILAEVIGFAGLTLIAIAFVKLNSGTLTPGVKTLIPVLGTALIIFAGQLGQGFITRILSTKPAVYLGNISYSLYIWHWPVLVFTSALILNFEGPNYIGLCLSVVLAICSYKFVETPFREGKLSLISLPKIISAGVVLPAMTAIILLVGASTAWGNAETQAQMRAMNKPLAVVEKGCYQPENPKAGIWNFESCTFLPSEISGKPVYLVGDSNAAQFVGGIQSASEATGRPFVIKAGSGCPLLDIETEGFRDGNSCYSFNLETLQFLMNEKAGTVVIANADFYFRSTDTGIKSNGNFIYDPSAKPSLYEQSLRRMIDDLKSAGHQVVLVATVPNWIVIDGERESISSEGCSVASITAWNCPNLSEPLSVKELRQGAIWDIQRKIAKDTNISYMNFGTSICPKGQCKFKSEGVWRYLDVGHIGNDMAQLLTPEWMEELKK